MPIAALLIEQIASNDDAEATLKRLKGFLEGYFQTRPKTSKEVESLVNRILQQAPENDLRASVVERIRAYERGI